LSGNVSGDTSQREVSSAACRSSTATEVAIGSISSDHNNALKISARGPGSSDDRANSPMGESTLGGRKNSDPQCLDAHP